MLKAQPRFSGNGGHGKRIADADEGIEKAYAPSKQLVAASRQAEQHVFRTAKPKPPTRNPQKVYSLSKGATAQQLHMADRAWRLTSAGERANARAQNGLKVSMPNAKKAREGVALRRRMVSEGLVGKAMMPVGTGLQTNWAAASRSREAGKTRKLIQTHEGGKPGIFRQKAVQARRDFKEGKSNPGGYGKHSSPEYNMGSRLANIREGKHTGIQKRARTYDSEMNRQRRQGMYVAGGALGGGALVASGGSEVRRASGAGREAQAKLSRIAADDTQFRQREFRGPHSVLARDKKTGGISRSSTGASRGKLARAGQYGSALVHPQGGTLTAAEREAYEGLNRLGLRVSGKAKGKLGAGVALLGGSAGMYKHSRSGRNKRWN